MLKDDEDIFLDDVTLKEVEKKLHIKAIITEYDGSDFIEKILTFSKPIINKIYKTNLFFL